MAPIGRNRKKNERGLSRRRDELKSFGRGGKNNVSLIGCKKGSAGQDEAA